MYITKMGSSNFDPAPRKIYKSMHGKQIKLSNSMMQSHNPSIPKIYSVGLRVIHKNLQPDVFTLL